MRATMEDGRWDGYKFIGEFVISYLLSVIEFDPKE
jgi:hypothetical protein